MNGLVPTHGNGLVLQVFSPLFSSAPTGLLFFFQR
jgi:hypothetical protein